MDRITRQEKIKQIINEYDPINLLSQECPNDEYSCEANLIESEIYCKNVKGIADIAKIVSAVFFEQFDERLDKSLCKGIARKILTVL